MHCYDCSRLGRTREAVGLCHHRSAAVCEEHACVVSETIIGDNPVVYTVELPKQARLMLCATCRGSRSTAGSPCRVCRD